MGSNPEACKERSCTSVSAEASWVDASRNAFTDPEAGSAARQSSIQHGGHWTGTVAE